MPDEQTIWDKLISWWDAANAWLAPWLQKYEVLKNAPVVVVAVVIFGFSTLAWDNLISGPRQKAQEIQAEENEIRREIEQSEKLDEILEALRKRSPTGTFDPTTEEGLRQTIANLLSAQDGARKRAADRLVSGDRDGALAELQQSAAQGEEATTDLAETYKEIGALAFADRTQDAIDAYTRAAQLVPDDRIALNQLALLHLRIGELAKAETAWKEALSHPQNQDEANQAWLLGNLGLVARTRGDLDAAEDYHKRALAMSEKLGSLEGQASQLGNLGLVAQTRGDLDAAEAYHKRSLAIEEKLGRLEGQANDLGNLGVVAYTRGDLGAAEDYLKRALDMNEKLGSLERQAINLGNLGLVARTRSDLDAAEDYHKHALAMDEKLGRLEGQAAQLGNLGIVVQTRGDLDAAQDYYQRSLDMNEKLGSLKGQAANLDNLGLVAEARGDTQLAAAYWQRSLALYRRIGMPHMVEQISGWLRGIGEDPDQD